MGTKTRLPAALLATSLLACGSDIGDRGTAVFTTWGEPFIEERVPPDPTGASGFVDGWTVKFEKFLVVFHDIQVGDRKGEIAARLIGSRLVDNVKPGRKTLATFSDVPAKSWDAVGYVIRPAFADSELIDAAVVDREMMAREGFAVFVQGTARKNDIVKTFRWGFPSTTQYTNCKQPPIGGEIVPGIVITNGGTDTSELTTHGDHLFRDRLPNAPGAPVGTKLRFDAIAAADRSGEGFGEITLDELEAAPADPPLYDATGLSTANLGTLVTELARTVGQFRGDGACEVTAIR